jgi:hypothetical protein
VRQFRPSVVSVADAAGADKLRALLGNDAPREIAVGAAGLDAVATADADLVVAALVGAAGLRPTLAAIRAGRDVALANKEVLVMAGALVNREVAAHGVTLLPVDSEHSAIFQALAGADRSAIAKLILTASGGPFRTWSEERIARATVEEALRHPNWDMGPKITIDSATLMNKGLEVIEARWLFDVGPERVEVVVHPQSIVHSLVEFCDTSVIAQLGPARHARADRGRARAPGAPAARRAASRPRRGRPARLRDARHQALPVSRAGLSRAARRRGCARGAERRQRGLRRGVPRRGMPFPGSRRRTRRCSRRSKDRGPGVSSAISTM